MELDKLREAWMTRLTHSSGLTVPVGTSLPFVEQATVLLRQYKEIIDVNQGKYLDLEKDLAKLDDVQAKAEFTLTAGQTDAIAKMNEWFKGDEPYFVLRGYAGTGKSTVVSVFAQHFSVYTVLFTAPTNKATKVLKQLLPKYQCRTIYSALSLKMVAREDELVLTPSLEKFNLSGFSIIFVDEASMLNTELMEYIDDVSRHQCGRFIFICDVAQLPPVGEDISPVTALECSYAQLSEVVRHKNQILDLATHVRKHVVRHKRLTPIDLSDFEGQRSVWQLSRRGFIERIQRLAEHGFKDCRAIAWRNRTVDYLNDVVRCELYTPEQRAQGTWLPDDNIVVTEPIGEGARTLATVDDEGIISSMDIGVDVETGLQCYFLSVKMEVGTTLKMRIIHETSADDYSAMLGKLASEARKPNMGKVWRAFWGLKARYNSIRHSYAITAHRSQGSTFRQVFVDAGDILANTDRDTAYRCLYVAVSRASERLYTTGLPR